MTPDDRPLADRSSSQLDIAEQLSVIVVNLAESAIFLCSFGVFAFEVLSQMAPIAVAVLLLWMLTR